MMVKVKVKVKSPYTGQRSPLGSRTLSLLEFLDNEMGWTCGPYG